MWKLLKVEVYMLRNGLQALNFLSSHPYFQGVSSSHDNLPISLITSYLNVVLVSAY